MTSCYYHPLPPIQEYGITPPFSRLVLLSSGRGNDPLCCTLEHFAVENPPPYEAVSYAWGQEDSPNLLYTQQGTLTIRKNLESLLRYLRLPTQARRLWVDAICINQSDVHERARQVQYMRHIYKHATRAIVWLGMRTPGVEDAFLIARQIAEYRRSATGPMGQDQGSNELVTQVLMANWEARNRLEELLRRPYFTRMWCVQEVLVSNWVVAQCEDLEIDFADLIASCLHVQYSQTNIFGSTLEFWNYLYLHRYVPGSVPKKSEVEGSLGSMLMLLITLRDFAATDPRDKIFTLFGISDEGLDPSLALTQTIGAGSAVTNTLTSGTRSFLRSAAKHINKYAPQGTDFGRHKALKPDYTKPFEEVFRDTVRFLVRKSPRLLDVLSQVQHTQDPTTRHSISSSSTSSNNGKLPSSLPSWVPNWSEPRSASIIGSAGMFFAGIWNAHTRYVASLHDCPISAPSLQPNILQVDGFRVDVVDKVSDVMFYELYSPVHIREVWAQLFGAPLPLPSSGRTYGRTGERLEVALCRALSADCFGAVMPKIFTGEAGKGDLKTKEDAMELSRKGAEAYMRALATGWDPTGPPADDKIQPSGGLTGTAVPMPPDIPELGGDNTALLNVVPSNPPVGYAAGAAGSQHQSAYHEANRSNSDRVSALESGAVDDATAIAADAYVIGARSSSHNRRAYITRSGALGIGPKVMKEGDEIVVLFGGRVPFLLRPADGGQKLQQQQSQQWPQHVFVGETYYYDQEIMWGGVCQGFKDGKRNDIRLETFRLV